ncbi:MAG: NHLP family bacteriocin export ABC transporter peptidase/permease/ATPase subunit [Pseudomonadota bacterium]|nr:NHLP family bacteriocin export ABC transporter peptidase/permease/ATPase subunit [Pseudomonadota bacterium]
MAAEATLAGFVPSPEATLRRVVTPSILQMEAVECGAAALAIVLAYHGRWVPLDELRLLCGVSRDGSKASNMLTAARHFGVEARGFRKDPEALLEMPLPLIAFWNFNHFVVVEGFRREAVYLNDPATGQRTVTWEEFDQSFTGVVLTFEPTDEFTPGGQRPGILRGLARRLASYKSAFVFLLLVGLALVLPGLVIPAFARVFVDEILIGDQHQWLMPLIVGMTLTAFVRGALDGLQQRCLLRMETSLAVASASQLFWHILRLPAEFFTQRYAGEVGSRVAISDRVARMIAAELPSATINLFTAVFFLVVMLGYDVLLTCVSLVFAGANVAVLRAVATRRKAMNQRLAIDAGKVAGASMNGLMLIETIKASGAEPEFFEKWAGYQGRFLNSMQDMGRASMALDTLPATLAAVEAALILGVGGLRVMDGAMTLGMLVAFQSLALSFGSPVRRLVDLGARIQQLQGDMDRLDDVMRAVPESDSPPGAQAEAGKLEGRVELRNVTFGYNRAGRPLLEDYSLAIEPGQRVALVGPSGCGKSTISRLMTGLFHPWSGEILLDGRPRAEWDRERLALSLAMVDQDIVLFEGTFRENLTLWDDSVSDSAIIRAAEDACIHDMILQRPGGYDGHIEEGGRNFSGGQRQRLEIARALVNDPRVLVLDEATSALDPVIEQRIDENLRRRGCTTVVVAHRLSTVRDANCIYVHDAARIVEQGTHDELMAIPDGVYARLVAAE